MFDFLAVPMNYAVTNLAVIAGVPLAIVLATLLVRVILLPLGYAQHRADQRRTDLLGRAAKLPEAERVQLLQAEGGNLARGCLPMLLQIPVFAAMYSLFVSPTVGGSANVLLTETMFGVPLGSHLNSTSAMVFLGLIALMALVGYLSTRTLPVKPTGIFKALPYVSTVFALFLPLAATLYLVTTTTWTVVQTVALRQFAP